MEGNGKEAVESMKGVRKSVKHAASAEAIARIVDHMTNSMSFHDVQCTAVQLGGGYPPTKLFPVFFEGFP